MKKTSKRILTIVLCILVAWYTLLTVSLSLFSIIFASGSSKGGLFMNPSKYEVASYNVVWTECKRKVKTTYFPSKVYYRITDTPLNEYVACYWRQSGIGTLEYPVLMAHKDFEVNLELDTSSAKLYMGDLHTLIEDDDFLIYGQKIMKKEVATLDSAIGEEIAREMNNDLLNYDEVRQLSGGKGFEGNGYLFGNDLEVLRVTIQLKEYDNLFFTACIVKCGDNYFLEIKDGLTSSKYMPCGEEFSAVINSVIS